MKDIQYNSISNGVISNDSKTILMAPSSARGIGMRQHEKHEKHETSAAQRSQRYCEAHPEPEHQSSRERMEVIIFAKSHKM
jgi:hypothetical protein